MKEIFTVPDFVQELLGASVDGLSSIAIKLSHYLSRPVVITDPLHNVLSSTLEDLINSQTKMEVYLHLEDSLRTPYSQCVLSFDNQCLEGFGHSILFENRVYGYIFVLLNDGEQIEMNEYESLIDYASSLCALQIGKKLDIKKERHRFKEAFLFDLLYGNFKKRDEIISYGAIWSWDFHLPHAVLVFAIKDYDYYSADKQLIHTLQYVVEKALIQRDIEPITFTKQNEVVIILPILSKIGFSDKKKLENFISYTISQAKKTNLANRVACGVGKLHQNPEDLFRSYQEAKVAFELGLLLEMDITFFNDLGLERVLYKHDLQDLKEFYDRVLGDLQKYDEANDSELMYTIENFVKYQFDLKQTSEALFLHRNTLRYRIKKMEEILDIKLDDINNRLNISAALKIKQLHKL